MLPSLQMYNIGVGCDGLPAVDQIQKFLADKCDAASGVWHNQPDGRIQVLTAQEPAGLELGYLLLCANSRCQQACGEKTA